MNVRAANWRLIRRLIRQCTAAMFFTIAIVGCGVIVPPQVVVYTSVDKEIALPIFAEFSKATGIIVRSKYSDKSGESRSLAQAIIAERDHTRCDLFWTNEILNTLCLEREEMLRPYTSPAASKYPASARSPHGTWYGIAADARVLIVNTVQIAEPRWPKSIQDLTDPQWYERTAIAKPLTGTAATHAACLFAAWGDTQAQEFFRAVKRNARILATNQEVAHTVATGGLAFGLTDSSDAVAELAAGAPVTIIYPDQAKGQLGTLFIPHTLALIKNSPHAEPAEQLLNFLLSPDVAGRLADGPSVLIPLQTSVARSDFVKSPTEVRAMPADFEAAAAQWETTAKFLREEFAAP